MRRPAGLGKAVLDRPGSGLGGLSPFPPLGHGRPARRLNALFFHRVPIMLATTILSMWETGECERSLRARCVDELLCRCQDKARIKSFEPGDVGMLAAVGQLSHLIDDVGL